MPKRRRQSRAGLTSGRRFDAWLEHHGQSALTTIDQLLRAPLATLLTVLAIAIALALPATLHVLTENLRLLGGGWQQSAAISLFLTPDLDEAAAAELAARLRSRPEIATTTVISRADGLAEFRAYSGLGGALDQLGDNPLPVVLAIDPTIPADDEPALQRLAAALEALPQGDFARLDTQWSRRFHGIVDLLHDGMLLLAGVLGLAVLLVVGNTVRLEIENRRGEIEVMDLVGATGAFIRRPFLYFGAWYGLLGGIVAWCLVAVLVALMQSSVNRLAVLYYTDFDVAGLEPRASLLLIGGALGLGVLGSWVAVGRHLRRVGPV
jgi:cell division transport system permease protein